MTITFHREKPYNDLPGLPPDTELESVAVLKAVTRAGRALAELKGRTHTLPNPALLLNTIALQEAKVSSEIENLFTTNDELYRGLASDNPNVSPHTKEVLHYNEALWLGARLLDERPLFTTNLFIDVVRAIKRNSAGIRSQTGTRIQNPDSGEIIYTPPEGEDVIREKLANLETFCNDDTSELDPLVKLAVIHYQFEAIHPFYDGNGRTGRILLILFLRFSGLLDHPVLFLSRYILGRKSDYYRLLREVTESGSWDPWLLYMLDAVRQTAEETSIRIREIQTLLDTMLAEGREKLSTRTFSKELIELLFYRPYAKIRFVEEAGIAKRVTASRYLHELAENGFVTPMKMGNEILFINHRLLALIAH